MAAPLMASGGFKMRVTVSGTCPCGQAFQAGYANVRLDEPDARQLPDDACTEPCVLHDTPHCIDFQVRDLVDYLAWTRGARPPLPAELKTAPPPSSRVN